MEEYKNKINELKTVDYSVFPDIDLYMDQILAYISRTPVSFRESDSLTSAMVNNYIKDGLLPRAKGKKYNKEHIVDLTVIARLKQVLSVKDVGVILAAAKNGREEEELYKLFNELLSKACENASEKTEQGDNMAQLALSLAVESYVYKVVSEYIIDSMKPEETHAEEKKKKQKNSDKE